MKNIKITTPVILGVISVLELIVSNQLGGSICLWLGYGVYKMTTSE